ncbi:ABC transporter permease [Ferrovibrio xuzhouensis]|uniref:ABC transporter permease n=1 Tax=Ferrovibrio xuzhouensis TaxID=1576914 RepID=A0ABV7VJA6_9PROT
MKYRRIMASLCRIAVAIPGALVLFFLTAPVLAVIPMSFGAAGPLQLIPDHPSFDQYSRFFSSPDWMTALWISVQVALGTTCLATVFGVAAALGLSRLSARWRLLLDAVLILPRIVPTIVFAVAAYSVFLKFHLVGSVFGLMLAHSVLAMPFVVVFVGSALRGLDHSLEEASRSLGANPAITFFRVVLPQIRLSLIGSALFAFNISFDEVVVTLFISGVYSKTLPVKVWDAIQYEVTPILPAISTLVILTTLALLLPLLLLRQRLDTTAKHR